MNKIIGIPADGPSLSDMISQHFGHCNYFVGVEITVNDGKSIAFSQRNEGHTACMEPVIQMKERNVTDMIVGGIGGRPFMGFVEMGINLFKGIEGTIEENVNLLIQGKLEILGGPSCAQKNH